MVAQTPAALTVITWRARRPWVRRRLMAALAAGGRTWRTAPELARLAGLAALPPKETQAALTDLVQAGMAEGVRGPAGWSRVRGLTIVIPESPEAPTTAGRRPRPAVSPEVSGREFSVATRVRRHRSSGIVSGALLFVVAILAAGAAALWLIRSWNAEPPAQPQTQEQWYQQSARRYVDAYLAQRRGYTLPFRFTEVTGVPDGAPRARLQEGMEQYIKAALFTGHPSTGGILAWARGEFGEVPGGEHEERWYWRVAETYAARSLAGTPGYEVTPALATAGGFLVEERDAALLTSGLARALQTAVRLGTPEPGGVLDWARRTLGDLPAR